MIGDNCIAQQCAGLGVFNSCIEAQLCCDECDVQLRNVLVRNVLIHNILHLTTMLNVLLYNVLQFTEML